MNPINLHPVRVCPELDRECGSNPFRWCMTCPNRDIPPSQQTYRTTDMSFDVACQDCGMTGPHFCTGQSPSAMASSLYGLNINAPTKANTVSTTAFEEPRITFEGSDLVIGKGLEAQEGIITCERCKAFDKIKEMINQSASSDIADNLALLLDVIKIVRQTP